ncbi:MAG TPA: MlaD family protein [Nocardioides sp.]|nr:MlaD family protein [Nocardioides sp.]
MNAIPSASRRTFVTAAVALALLVVAGVVMVTRGGDDPDSRLIAVIPDAGALEEGAEVRASGVLVGQVSSIDLVDGKARVAMDLNDGVLPVHRDATLTVKPVNLLGESFLALDPGSDDQPFLASNEIPADQVSSAVTLQDVLDTFHAPTAAGLAAVVTALGEGMADNGGEVSEALKALLPAMTHAQELGRILSRQNQVLGDLVATADPVAAALADDKGRTLDRLLSSTEDALAAIHAHETAFGEVLAQLPSTLVSAQRTLAEFGGVADTATPTLRALRPLTGDLQSVVAELKDFADAADPALAALEPVLQRADDLLTAAAPVVARLRSVGPNLRRAAASLLPVGRQLLDQHLHGVMEFVRKWALSTNGRDGISHYFRGVIYVTPTTLDSLLQSFVPADLGGSPDSPSATTPDSPGNLLPDLTGPLLGPDSPLGNTLDGLLGGILGNGRATHQPATRTDRTSALGLRRDQEQRLVGQLLGGQR